MTIIDAAKLVNQNNVDIVIAVFVILLMVGLIIVNRSGGRKK